MKELIDQRFQELINQGKQLEPYAGHDYWIPDRYMSDFQTWLSSVSHLLATVTQTGSFFREESNRLMTDKDASMGIATRVFSKMLGLLKSAQEEWSRGLLRSIEFLVAAETFDDFLDHASTYHKGNKLIESAVLASSVLEDTIKKIAQKNSISTKGSSLESLIDSLIEKNVFTPVKGKRVKAYAAVRNKALHAEWNEFDIKDVGELIKGLREIIADFL